MNRNIALASFLSAALILLAPASADAQRGGHAGFGGARSGFGGFSSGRVGGGFHSGVGSFDRGSVGRGVFSPGSNRFSFHYGDRDGRFYNRGFFFPRRNFLYGSFGSWGPSFGFWLDYYSYWPGYTYWPYYTYSYPYYDLYIPPQTGESPQAASTLPAERYWLLALKDDTIPLVSNYWLDGSTLHYVARDGKQLSLDLSTVNMDLTKQLNRQRGLDFQLPRPQSEYQPQRRDAYGRAY